MLLLLAGMEVLMMLLFVLLQVVLIHSCCDVYSEVQPCVRDADISVSIDGYGTLRYWHG